MSDENNTNTEEVSVQKTGETVGITTSEYSKLQELAKNPTTIGVLEFVTGVTANTFSNPANLILSGGRLTQALFKGEFHRQLYSEVHKYRSEGKISDEQLNSNRGKTLFIEVMRIIDEESLDVEKFEVLKAIFLKSVFKDTDEHKQMLAYQYFQVCKKLSSLDILILKASYEISIGPDGNQNSSGIGDWELRISDALGIPRELISQRRILNSPVSQTPNTVVFNAEAQDNRHGLSSLGIAIGEYLYQE